MARQHSSVVLTFRPTDGQLKVVHGVAGEVRGVVVGAAGMCTVVCRGAADAEFAAKRLGADLNLGPFSRGPDGSLRLGVARMRGGRDGREM